MLRRVFGAVCVWFVALAAHALEFGAPRWMPEPKDSVEIRVPITDLAGHPVNQLLPVFGSEATFLRQGIERSPDLSDLFHRIEQNGTVTELVLSLDSSWPTEKLSTVVEVFTPSGVAILPIRVSRTQVEPVSREIRVANGATLWRIAQQVQPDGATVEQVMMALFDANPNAFEIGNVNALEKNQKLGVPPVEVILAVDVDKAAERFKAHMAEPRRDFWSVKAERIASESAQPESPSSAPEPELTVSATPAAPVGRLSEGAAGTESVDALLQKIQALESKLDQVDAKLAQIVETPAVPPAVVPEAPVSTGVDWRAEGQRVLNAIPSRSEFMAFARTEIGQGTLIFMAVLLAFGLLRRVYAGSAPQPVSTPGSVSVSPAHDSVPAGVVRADLDALEDAINRLKQKIEDPTRMSEAEALYQDGDELLIDAFSAESLNENPEWGEDPDDEAEVAAHQLQLAENYLGMGMRETAIELLERVRVSPHTPSAEKAKARLNAVRGA